MWVEAVAGVGQALCPWGCEGVVLSWDRATGSSGDAICSQCFPLAKPHLQPSLLMGIHVACLC